MKVGLIARADDRGLGIQTWEWARAMHPDKVLLVDLIPRRFPIFPERFPGATAVRCAGHALPERLVRRWLRGLDVVYTAETFYDWRLCRWAREQGVATVCHVNPEFHVEHLDVPTAWWAPSSWRLDLLPPGTVHVPVPVALDRWPDLDLKAATPTRWLHVAGHRSIADRNGTLILLDALRYVRRAHRVRIATQTTAIPPARVTTGVVVERRRDVANYWELYDDADVLVMPRRFGGLCLPVLEAMGAGLAVMMSDCSPQHDDWPVGLIEAQRGPPIDVPGGRIELQNVNPRRLAALMDDWADPVTLSERRCAARCWAETQSWAVRAPQVRQVLQRVVERA